MKSKLFFFVLALFVSAPIFAQVEKPANTTKPHPPMNFFKINLFAVPLKNYSFQYERVLSRKFSFALGFRTMPNGKLPLKRTVDKMIGDDADAKKQVDNFTFGNTAITPEIRFYVGKKGYGRGFYMAPFYRYGIYKGNGLNFTYSNSANVESTIALSGELKSNTFGIMFGAQWALGKHVSLDWWILGPQYGTAKGDFTGVSSKIMAQDEQADLRQELEDFDVPLTTKTITVNAAGANVKLDGPFAGVRSGLCIGIRF